MEIFGLKVDSFTVSMIIICATVMIVFGIIYIILLKNALKKLRQGFHVSTLIEKELEDNPALENQWKKIIRDMDGVTLEKLYIFGEYLRLKNMPVSIENFDWAIQRIKNNY